MYKLIIAGGGTGSVAVVGHLLRSGRLLPKDILVIEPSLRHFYQPGFTMIGGGLLGDHQSALRKSTSLIESPTSNMFIPGVSILPKSVSSFDPDNNSVLLSDGTSVQYENLVVAMGFKPNFEAIPGLLPALKDEQSKVCSIYSWDYALKTNRLAAEFQGGNAVFCMPTLPIKCPGAPQKIMYLSHDRFMKAGINNAAVHYYCPQPAIFAVPKYARRLWVMAKDKGIAVNTEHLLTRIDDSKRLAYLKNSKEEIEVPYDFLHVAPPCTPHEVLKKSKLVDANGYVDVNKETMRHAKFSNIWALGDCSNVPTPKTMAGALSQSIVLAHNYVNSLDKKETNAKYTGYTSCPIFVGQTKLMLCEFKYGFEVDETFTKYQDTPNIFFYWVKRFFFPRVYFTLVKRGLWFGRNTFFKPKFF